MKKVYIDYSFFSSNRHGRVGNFGLVVLLIVAFLFLALGVGAFYFRRDISDAWRQWRIASIPVPETPVSELEKPKEKDVVPETPEFIPDTKPIDSEPKEPVEILEPENEPAELEEITPPLEPPLLDLDVLPERVNLNVPIVYQAPFNAWDPKHDDACEEASILMVQAFLEGRISLTRQEMEDKIMALIDYQMDTLGYFESTNAELTAKIMREFVGLERVAVLPVNSIDDIRRQLAAGRPVIIPADGKALKNPNFRGDGPTYHMYVAKGYTQTHIIAHDPGTRRGANWLYTNEIVMDSLADWIQDEQDVDRSKHYMIVIW